VIAFLQITNLYLLLRDLIWYLKYNLNVLYTTMFLRDVLHCWTTHSQQRFVPMLIQMYTTATLSTIYYAIRINYT
jgi:hypothetical protein